MIYLENNKKNKVVLTLSENSEFLNSDYLFVFKAKFGNFNKEIFFTTADLSTTPSRFNLFEIELDSLTGSTTGGTSVALSMIPGQYDYRVYESALSGSTLEISGTTGRIIGQGRLTVEGLLNYNNNIIQNNIYL
jgi:hypothetical protein